MSELIINTISKVNQERLKKYVKSIAGLRHGYENYEELKKRSYIIEDILNSFNLVVKRQEFSFFKKNYTNIIATKHNNDSFPFLLIGAHYDSAWGSPGADDNASGVAVLLEAANILSSLELNHTIQFVAFTLEEPQPQTLNFLIGSSYFVEKAKREGINYNAVFILESVGYTDSRIGSQTIPLFIKKKVSNVGDFLAVIANRKSKSLMDFFTLESSKFVPDLQIYSYKVPLSGRLIPETRFSDHAPFWNKGYPAIMLTDTAMFRNPHYHTYHDTIDTLDFSFIEKVTKALISVIISLDNTY